MATWTQGSEPARFRLVRHRDVSGISGTGVVAYGTWYPNGLVGLAWDSFTPTLTTFIDVYDVEQIHGHDGATVVEWIDPAPPEIRQAISSAVVRVP